jgi:FkbM family methyltransferase
MAFNGDRGIDSMLRIFYPRRKGQMVEVGAAGPDYLSIGKHFRGIGWNVLSIEPNPKFAEEHRKLGHKIVECACGIEDKDGINFELATAKVPNGRGTSESFSSISIKEELKRYFPISYSQLNIEKIKVNLRRLDTILKESGITNIDILTIDTEGWELEVIKGLDLKNYSPNLILIENYSRDSRYNSLITGYGYKLVCQLYPNYLYIKKGMFSGIQILASRIYSNILKIKGVSYLVNWSKESKV